MGPVVAVIINPISGAGGRVDGTRQLAADAARLLGARKIQPRISYTEGAGHATELTAAAVRAGAETVVAWGGDGTVNEVASALAFGEVRLGIVPAGSGNGLARGLGIPGAALRALEVAVSPHSRRIDVGEFDGRLFVNLAGIGLDAAIAHAFARGGLKRRGFRRYVEIALKEVVAFQPSELTVLADGESIVQAPLLLTLSNGTQYGGGAVIAPGARLDDGKLDLVMAAPRSAIVALLQAPLLFARGRIALPRVSTREVAEVSISARAPIRYHVDGEPCTGGTTVRARVHPRALTIAVPVR